MQRIACCKSCKEIIKRCCLCSLCNSIEHQKFQEFVRRALNNRENKILREKSVSSTHPEMSDIFQKLSMILYKLKALLSASFQRHHSSLLQ
ncbi:unnamed protein product [Moneuplotes crassus]|uniref:Uncharacterized protein n=1 Tax=Euplotes crassus TaxID=5936 RepID=A0AAD2D0I4_EUPCR|nr:unnamed protein product [Moneuplotes crassus]